MKAAGPFLEEAEEEDLEAIVEMERAVIAADENTKQRLDIKTTLSRITLDRGVEQPGSSSGS